MAFDKITAESLRPTIKLNKLAAFEGIRLKLPEQRQVIERVGRSLQEATSALSDFITDIETEAQNSLLGTLFDGCKRERRAPMDPTRKVMVGSPQEAVDALIHHFKNETEWGRRQAAAIVRAQETLRQRDAAIAPVANG